jgi:hypothetical protein
MGGASSTGSPTSVGGSGGAGGASTAAGGASTSGGGSGGGTVELDCDATMPTSGGEQHSATWAEGGSGNLAWQIWTNGGPGTIITYAGITAFTASWNNSGDYLGRLGFEWGNSGKQYTEYGTIKADYVWNKSGNAGQYSYLGLYGWSTNPCVEWYIVARSTRCHSIPAISPWARLTSMGARTTSSTATPRERVETAAGAPEAGINSTVSVWRASGAGRSRVPITSMRGLLKAGTSGAC